MTTQKKHAVNGSLQSNTGTGAGSASNSSPASGGSNTPTVTGGAPVVAPKGLRLKIQQMLAGWQAVIPSDSGVPYQGSTLGQAAVVSQLQEYLADYSALDSAQLALKTARAPVQTDEPVARAYLAQLKVALSAFFGASSPQLAQFGLKPRAKAKALTTVKQMERVAKAQNTREIRGTAGKLQKASQKSGPVQISVDPVASPVPPTSDGPASNTAASPGTGK